MNAGKSVNIFTPSGASELMKSQMYHATLLFQMSLQVIVKVIACDYGKKKTRKEMNDIHCSATYSVS